MSAFQSFQARAERLRESVDQSLLQIHEAESLLKMSLAFMSVEIGPIRWDSNSRRIFSIETEVPLLESSLTLRTKAIPYLPTLIDQALTATEGAVNTLLKPRENRS